MAEENCCLRCLSVIPVASLLAAAIQIIGLIMFLGVVVNVMGAFSDFFDTGMLSSYFKLVAIVGIVVSVLFLVLAFMSTGYTREKVCGGAVTNVCGRIITIVDMAICWILSILSMGAIVLITGVTMVATVLFFACEGLETLKKGACLEIKNLHLGWLLKMKFGSLEQKLCGDTALKLCKQSGDIWTSSLLGIVAAIVMLIGYVIGLQTMAANYVHIKHDMEKERKEPY